MGLPRGLFPPTFIVVTCFATFVSSLLIALPYHEMRFWATYVVIGLTIAPVLDFSFLIRSFLVLPSIHLNIFILVVCIICCSALCSAQHSLPYIKVGLMTVLYNLFFILHQITLSKSSTHADRTLLSTSAPHPPVAYIVEPKYMKELVHGIGTPAKQTSSLNPACLKYSVFFLLILSPFPSSTSLQLSRCCSISTLDYSHITRSSAKSIAHDGSL